MSSNNGSRELGAPEIAFIVKNWFQFLLSKWVVILTVAIIFAVSGVTYAWMQKPEYTAEITFAPENDNNSSIGAYSGLAAQFGLDLGAMGGSTFQGDNLMELLRSKLLIERTLFSHLSEALGSPLLVNDYTRLKKIVDKQKRLIVFDEKEVGNNRAKDSVLKKIEEDIGKNLEIEKVDKKIDIISVKLKSDDELFAKVFVENLMTEGIDYYVNYRSKKSRENVDILQRQADSVKSMLSGNFVEMAASSDLNVNPIRQIARVGAQKKQIDAQANAALYAEIVKQLELSKIALRKSTPFIQIIDTPRLPLDKKKLGRLKAAVIFAFVGGFIAIVVLVTRRIFFPAASRYSVNKRKDASLPSL